MKFINLISFSLLIVFSLNGCSTISKTLPTQKPQINDLAKFNTDIQEAKNNPLFYESRQWWLKESKEISDLTSKYFNNSIYATSLTDKKADNIYLKWQNFDKSYIKQELYSEELYNLYQNQNLIIQNKTELPDSVFLNNATDIPRNNKKSKLTTNIGVMDKVNKGKAISLMQNNNQDVKDGFINFNKPIGIKLKIDF
ncbi:hypothetical protein ACHJH3_08855 [Campylobacter sp. MOP7]|uniref:hypothetical protein n=1 Tax=Campylobacter canis TaxID=3378588 RepID=UPI00387E84C6